ncbi:MAG: hypothetical protein ACO2PN_07435 [Pyrobaculum sp.]
MSSSEYEESTCPSRICGLNPERLAAVGILAEAEAPGSSRGRTRRSRRRTTRRRRRCGESTTYVAQKV